MAAITSLTRIRRGTGISRRAPRCQVCADRREQPGEFTATDIRARANPLLATAGRAQVGARPAFVLDAAVLAGAATASDQRSALGAGSKSTVSPCRSADTA